MKWPGRKVVIACCVGVGDRGGTLSLGLWDYLKPLEGREGGRKGGDEKEGGRRVGLLRFGDERKGGRGKGGWGGGGEGGREEGRKEIVITCRLLRFEDERER